MLEKYLWSLVRYSQRSAVALHLQQLNNNKSPRLFVCCGFSVGHMPRLCAQRMPS